MRKCFTRKSLGKNTSVRRVYLPPRCVLSSDIVNYYAIQVRTRSEEKFMRLFAALHPHVSFPLHFPRRRLDIRRKGVTTPSMAPIFPGYIFIESESEDIFLHQWLFRRTEGFFRFLRSNQNIKPLAGRDLELVLHFIKRVGPVAGASRVRFDENSRIEVMDGPMAGLEGRIIKVDKRKKRAKVRLDLCGDFFTVDLAFEVMEALVKD